MNRSIGIALGCLLVAAAGAGAQSPIATWESQAPEIGFGMVLAAAGDVDGDGVPDAITGSPNAQGYRGAARVISGADGSTLFALTNPGPAGKPLDYLGSAVAGCGDLDGDGRCEFAVGQSHISTLDLGGRARIYRGSDGTARSPSSRAPTATWCRRCRDPSAPSRRASAPRSRAPAT